MFFFTGNISAGGVQLFYWLYFSFDRVFHWCNLYGTVFVLRTKSVFETDPVIWAR